MKSVLVILPIIICTVIIWAPSQTLIYAQETITISTQIINFQEKSSSDSLAEKDKIEKDETKTQESGSIIKDFLFPFVVAIAAFLCGQVFIIWWQNRKSRLKLQHLYEITRHSIQKELDNLCLIHAFLWVKGKPSFRFHLEFLNELRSELLSFEETTDIVIILRNLSHQLEHIMDRLANLPKNKKSSQYITQIRSTHQLVLDNIKSFYEDHNRVVDAFIKKNNSKKLDKNYLKNNYEHHSKENWYQHRIKAGKTIGKGTQPEYFNF